MTQHDTSTAEMNHTLGGSDEPQDPSIGQLVGEIANDLTTLMRQELDLAKAEMKQEAGKIGKASGMLGGAALAGWMLLLFFSVALMWLLGEVMDLQWAALIVAALWAAVGLVLYATGRNRLRTINLKPERTVETLKEDVKWAQNRNS